MKILVIGKFYTEGFALHISETLKSMGHSVICIEPGLKERNYQWKFSKRWMQVKQNIYNLSDNLAAIRAKRLSKLFGKIGRNKIDLTIVCHDRFLWPKEVEKLKTNTKTPVVLWFPDYIGNLKGYFANAPYDAVFFKDPFIVQTMKGFVSPPVYYLPECFNPLTHRLPDLEAGDLNAYICDITTAGNMHSYRVAFFKQLEEYHVKLWGNPPPLWLQMESVNQMYQNKPVTNKEKAKAFRGARIVINNLHPGEMWGVNVRTFEIAGIGGFQLVNWRPGLNQLFEDSKEIVSFTSMEDLKEKIDYYLDHENERNVIAKAGMEKAYREHTYSHRLNTLIETVKGRAKGFPLPEFISGKEQKIKI